MNTYTLYEAAGRGYRGFTAGQRFTARFKNDVEARALARGNIRVVERLIPALPVNRKLPPGWAGEGGNDG